MKLYSATLSPNSLRSRLIAAELELNPEIVEVNLGKGEHRTPEYLKLNPNGKVPTLVDGDAVVWESRAINAYLASRRPERDLYPADPVRRAAVDQWSYWQAIHFGPAIQKVAFERVQKPLFGRGEPDEAAITADVKTMNDLLPILDAGLAGREFVAGALSIVDFALAGTLVLRKPGNLGIEAFANISSWLERVESRPSWRATLAGYYDGLRQRGLKL